MRPTLPTRPPHASPLRVAVVALVGAVLFALLSPALSGPADAVGGAAHAAHAPSAKKKDTPNPVTPGDFTGYGFDQCLTPTQEMMDAWLRSSPYLAVGIYISGDSRACRNQPNLTPTWVRTQLAKGWRLLPITLGPQASCQPRFPRYNDDFTINPQPGGAGKYSKARTMGQDSAVSTVADAKALGIVPGSTLWYDLEGFDHNNTHCRESALAFLSAWTKKVKSLGYVTGVYSSAGSGLKALDDARVNRPDAFTFPDRIWIARWDGIANTSTSYLRNDGWRPGGRMKQYRGGHDEVHGGVRINIDSNYLDLGKGSVAAPETHCGGVTVSFQTYEPIGPSANGSKSAPRLVRALQCLLSQKGVYGGKINGVYHSGVVRAAQAWRSRMGFPTNDDRWFRRDWMSVLAFGARPVLKFGSSGAYVRRVQRALNAADLGASVRNSGVFDAATTNLVKAYQKRMGLPETGVVESRTWGKLYTGKR